MQAMKTAALGFGAGLLGAVVGVAGMGAGQNDLRTRAVVVESSDGTALIKMGSIRDGKGGPFIHVMDGRGKMPRLTLSFPDSRLSVTASDAEGIMLGGVRETPEGRLATVSGK